MFLPSLDLLKVILVHLCTCWLAAFFFFVLITEKICPCSRADIYIPVSKPLWLTREACLLFQGTGHVEGKEAQTPRCCLCDWWLTSNQSQEGEDKFHPWMQLMQRLNDAVRNSMNSRCQLPTQPSNKLLTLHCPTFPALGAQTLIFDQLFKAFIHKFNRFIEKANQVLRK